jgi:hypothetical protein
MIVQMGKELSFSFWRNTRTEKHHPDPPELTPDPPVIPVVPRASTRGCTCEFCGCRLTSDGEIIKMGETAKAVRKHEEEIENLKKVNDDSMKEIARLKAQVPTAPRRMPI